MEDGEDDSAVAVEKLSSEGFMDDSAEKPAAGGAGGPSAAASKNAGEMELETPFVEKYRPVFVSVVWVRLPILGAAARLPL